MNVPLFTGEPSSLEAEPGADRGQCVLWITPQPVSKSPLGSFRDLPRAETEQLEVCILTQPGRESQVSAHPLLRHPQNKEEAGLGT